MRKPISTSRSRACSSSLFAAWSWAVRADDALLQFGVENADFRLRPLALRDVEERHHGADRAPCAPVAWRLGARIG